MEGKKIENVGQLFRSRWHQGFDWILHQNCFLSTSQVPP